MYQVPSMDPKPVLTTTRLSTVDCKPLTFNLLAIYWIVSALLFPFDGVEHQIAKGGLVGGVRKLLQ